MDKPCVRIYTDYKSPYAFVANKRLFEIEEQLDVELEWLPYTLRVAEFMGSWRKAIAASWRRLSRMSACATICSEPGRQPHPVIGERRVLSHDPHRRISD
jgi:hypothetical protein